MLVGGLLDRIALRTFASVAAFGLMLACLLMSLANNLVLLALSFYLLRLFGQGLLPHTGITTMARYFDTNRGKAISIAGSGVPLGEIVLPIIAVALIAAMGWQITWRIFAVTVPFIYVPLMWWLLKCGKANNYSIPIANISPHVSGRRKMLEDQRFWFALPALLAGPFIITGIFIHQGYIAEDKQWSQVLFASCFVIYGFVHWGSSIVGGVLVDRWTATRLYHFFLVPMLIGLFATAILSGPVAAIVLMISLGITLGTSIPVFGSLWAEVYGTERLGAIRSLVSSLGVLSSSLSPALFGIFIDSGMSANTLLGSMGLYALVASLLTIASYKHTNPVAEPTVT